MRNIQDAFETRKPSFISAFLICTNEPLSKKALHGEIKILPNKPKKTGRENIPKFSIFKLFTKNIKSITFSGNEKKSQKDLKLLRPSSKVEKCRCLWEKQ